MKDIFCIFSVAKGGFHLRSRAIISALIFLSLCTVKVYRPAAAAVLRAYIRPAVTQEVSLSTDAEALGRALAGGGSMQAVWSRWMAGRSDGAVQSSEETAAPAKQTNAAEAFSRQQMAQKSLRGFESLAGLPEPTQQPEVSVPPSPAPSPTPSPTPPPAPEPTPTPVPEREAKLTAFLAEQAAFSDYAVPANVSYKVPTLPFEYASPVKGVVSSGFGFREHPLEGGVLFHYGTDFAVVDGTSVHAFADGTVLTAGEVTGYGQTIIVGHADGWHTLYAHCGSLLVKAGDAVHLGDKIALSGHTGNVTGPHLHFELQHNGFYVNPEFYC